MEILQGDDAIYIWYTISFFIFVGILYKFLFPMFIDLIDKRIADVKDQLKNAENLRIEAQEMLAQYQRKQRDALTESENIIKVAQDGAAKIRENAEIEIKETIARRERQLEIRLHRMEEDALNEIKAYAGKLAMEAARQIISEKLDKATNTKLLEASIQDVHTNIH